MADKLDNPDWIIDNLVKLDYTEDRYMLCKLCNEKICRRSSSEYSRPNIRQHECLMNLNEYIYNSIGNAVTQKVFSAHWRNEHPFELSILIHKDSDTKEVNKYEY